MGCCSEALLPLFQGIHTSIRQAACSKKRLLLLLLLPIAAALPHIKLHGYVLRLLHRSTSCRPHGALVLLPTVLHELQLSVLLDDCTATDKSTGADERSNVPSNSSNSLVAR